MVRSPDLWVFDFRVDTLYAALHKNAPMAELAYAIALGAIGVTLGGSNPLPPIFSS